nr:hypothetical protein [Tanacetum cinerariifolium]
ARDARDTLVTLLGYHAKDLEVICFGKQLSTAGPTTTPITTTIFDDEEMTLADTLIKLKDDKAKDKGKGVLEEPESTKKITKSDFEAAQISRDEEIARTRKKQLAEERVAAIKNKPPTKTQLRRLMMTYLKNMGRFTHNQLNKKSFKDIQGLYMKEHELIANFVPIGSEEDERMTRDMNKKAEEESSDKEYGTEIHMLAERRYSLTIRTLERMLSLRLIAESASDAAYDLLRFIQKQIDESRGNDRG